MPIAAPEVVVEKVVKSFSGKPVLDGIDLVIGRGELVAIVGGSGCGKTVLLKHMTGSNFVQSPFLNPDLN